MNLLFLGLNRRSLSCETSQVERGEENWLCLQPRGKQITVHRNKHCDWFVVRLLPVTLMIWCSIDCRKQICEPKNEWEHSESLNSSAVELMTLITNLLLDFN